MKKEKRKLRRFPLKTTKGLSAIIATFLIVLLVLVATGISWVIIKNVVQRNAEIVEITSAIFNEKMDMVFVAIDDSDVNLSIKKLSGDLILSNKNLLLLKALRVDMVSVVDLSGSMRACESTNANCNTLSECTSVLGAPLYSGGTCYGVNSALLNNCEDICGGVLVDRLTPTQDANKDIISSILTEENLNTSSIGLVAYRATTDESASLEITNNVAQLNSVVDLWEAEGNTCICCGINSAKEKLLASPKDKMKAIIVMSDGEANRVCGEQGTGNAKSDAIAAACDAYSELESLTIYTVGAGTGVDNATLINIASSCGNGTYFSVDDTDQLIGIYKAIAKDIKRKFKLANKFNYISVIFFNETSSYEEIIVDIPDYSETRKYEFNLEGNLEGELTKIEIYPVVAISSKNKVVGPLLDTWINPNNKI